MCLCASEGICLRCHWAGVVGEAHRDGLEEPQRHVFQWGPIEIPEPAGHPIQSPLHYTVPQRLV